MVLLWGIIGYIYGRRALKISFVPILLLLLAVPLPQIIVNTLTLPLKSLVSSFSAEILRLLNIAVLQEGNILVLPGITLEVVNACSGIRSVFALLVLAFLLSYDMKSPLQRALLVILTVPLAVFTNSLRITATGILASNWNAETALHFYHDFGGWVIFVVSLVLLFALKKLIHVYRISMIRYEKNTLYYCIPSTGLHHRRQGVGGQTLQRSIPPSPGQSPLFLWKLARDGSGAGQRRR